MFGSFVGHALVLVSRTADSIVRRRVRIGIHVADVIELAGRVACKPLILTGEVADRTVHGAVGIAVHIADVV